MKHELNIDLEHVKNRAWIESFRKRALKSKERRLEGKKKKAADTALN